MRDPEQHTYRLSLTKLRLMEKWYQQVSRQSWENQSQSVMCIGVETSGLLSAGVCDAACNVKGCIVQAVNHKPESDVTKVLR